MSEVKPSTTQQATPVPPTNPAAQVGPAVTAKEVVKPKTTDKAPSEKKFTHGPFIRAGIAGADAYVGAPGTGFGSPTSELSGLNSVGGQHTQNSYLATIGWNVDVKYAQTQNGRVTLLSSYDIGFLAGYRNYTPLPSSGITGQLSSIALGGAVTFTPVELELEIIRRYLSISLRASVRAEGSYNVAKSQEGTNYPGSSRSEFYNPSGPQVDVSLPVGQVKLFRYAKIQAGPTWTWGVFDNAVQKQSDPNAKTMGTISKGVVATLSGTVDFDSLRGPAAAPKAQPAVILPDNCTPANKRSVRESIIQILQTRDRLTTDAAAAVASGKTAAEVKASLTNELTKARESFIRDRLSERTDVKRYRDTLIGNQPEGKLSDSQKREIEEKVKAFIKKIAITDKEKADAANALPDIIITEELINSLGVGDQKVTIVRDQANQVTDVILPDAEKCGDLAARFQSTVTAAGKMKSPEVKKADPIVIPSFGGIANYLGEIFKVQFGIGKPGTFSETGAKDPLMGKFRSPSTTPAEIESLLNNQLEGGTGKNRHMHGLSVALQGNGLSGKTVPPFAKVEYDKLAYLLRVAPETVTIYLIGKHDSRGNPTSNKEVSFKRPETVALYLKKDGVKAEIVPVGQGVDSASFLIDDKDTGRKKVRIKSKDATGAVQEKTVPVVGELFGANRNLAVVISVNQQLFEKAIADKRIKTEDLAKLDASSPAPAATEKGTTAAAPASEKGAAAATPASEKGTKAQSKGKKLEKAKKEKLPAENPAAEVKGKKAAKPAEARQSKANDLPSAGPAKD